MGSMIGSGIFIVSADVRAPGGSPDSSAGSSARRSPSSRPSATSRARRCMPHAGGQYVYLREAFGPLWGFLYGWTLFPVIQTGTIAAVAVALPNSSASSCPRFPPATIYRLRQTRPDHAAACRHRLLILLTLVNTRGIRTGAIVQNVFTFAKVASCSDWSASASCWAATLQPWRPISTTSGAMPAGAGPP